LDQGLLGLLAFGGLLITAVWPTRSTDRWRPAALASLGVILLHGLVDDAFYGYGGWAVTLLFVPFALLARSESPRVPARRSARPALIFWGIAAMLLVAAFFMPAVQAAFKANLGAVSQTRTELVGYHWPESKFQDAVRRSAKDKLAPAIAWYQSALDSDPANATANRRLGQIELAFEQYDAACKHLAAAYAAAPSQRATRQLLGECFALAGETDQAVELWRMTDLSEDQLQLREWWYAEYLDDREHAGLLTKAIADLDKR
jgi:tetratricopeptide (TPR) repeat protein